MPSCIRNDVLKIWPAKPQLSVILRALASVCVIIVFTDICSRHKLTVAVFWGWTSIGTVPLLVPLLLLLSSPLLQRHVVKFRLEMMIFPVEVTPGLEVVVPVAAKARFVERVVIPWKAASFEREGKIKSFQSSQNHPQPHYQCFAGKKMDCRVAKIQSTPCSRPVNLTGVCRIALQTWVCKNWTSTPSAWTDFALFWWSASCHPASTGVNQFITPRRFTRRAEQSIVLKKVILRRDIWGEGVP